MAQLLLTGSSLTASASSTLEEALLLLEARIATWANNSDAYNALLQNVFGAQSSEASSHLQVSLSGSGLGISFEILDGASLSGINAAYTSADPTGQERIYLNADWLQSATAAEIEAVLLEELGHAIDQRLNGDRDTTGDEGEIFSARLRGLSPSSSASSENDHRLISLNGVPVGVEASDPAAPDPTYAAPSTNPFGIISVDVYTNQPALADVDGDGDLDLFIGTSDGTTTFFRNTAAPGSSVPAYTAPTVNPFGITDVGDLAAPVFADIDRDGDLDLFIGNLSGNILFFRNTAAAWATAPAYASPSANPFGIATGFYNGPNPTVVGYAANPDFVDADRDGDLDLFIGNDLGQTAFFRNTAALGSTTPAYNAENITFGGFTSIFGYRSWGFSPIFGITDVGSFTAPSFADIDDDGDLDLYIGDYDGNTLFFHNTAATPVAPVNSSTANGTYHIGDVITLTLEFSEPVLVNGTPRLQLETGIIDRFATYSSGSGSSTLSFQYTVQAGDTSADLDQLSAHALSLNGGTIRDAAGNNAILTLAAPGASGSLGANADLVIEDTTAPTVSLVASTTANGTYGIGAVITVTVQFSEAVLVSGSPQLQLETGATDRLATYSSGSGSDTLSFQYTVEVGDTSADLDQLSATALSLNGGTIRDGAGNNAVLTLPAPGAAGSLGANADLVIDGVAPTLQSSTPADGATNVALSSTFVLNFSESVVAGTGLIGLYRANGTLVESFDVATGSGSAGGSVGFSGSDVSINPSADLVRGSGYYLTVAATAVVDGVGNAYAGISDAISLNFNTAPVTVSVGSISVSESSLYAVVEVGLDAPISDDLSFTPALVSGTASTGSDTGATIWAYVGSSWISASSGVTLAAGNTSVLLRVAINNDATLEGLETFQISTGAINGGGAGALTNAAGAAGTVTIADEGSSAQIFDQNSNSPAPLIRSVDNDTPSITVSSVIVSEASPKAVLQVSLSNPSNFPISLTPALQSGSATTGIDTASTLEVLNGSSWETAGLVSFAAGVTSRLLRVAIVNDGDYEASESFTINTGAITGAIANPSGATGTVTIRDNGSSSNTFLDSNNSATPTPGTADNDTPPLPALSAAVLTNGNETGPVASSFRISRSGSTSGALDVSYRFDGNAIPGSDYTTPAGFDASSGLGTVTIAAGQSSVDLSVPTVNDSAVDGNRSLSLNLQESLSYTFAAGTATASILDNDVVAPVTPTLAISGASVVETDAGSNPTIYLSVSLSAAAVAPVSVHARTLAASSGTSASGGSDYTAISDRLLTFVPGATSQQLAVQLLGDDTIESTESFRVELFNANGATLPAAAATIEIVDNDSGKSLTIDNSATTTNQTFSGGQYADVLIGGSARDTINGDPTGLIGGGDAITGGPSADILTGGPGGDRFRYLAFSDSTLTSTDRIRDLILTGSDQDRIALAALPSALWNTGLIKPASATLASAVAKAFADKDVSIAGDQSLAGGEAVLFAYDSTPGNTRTRQWFVAVNDSNAGFSATDDLLINVTGLSSSFSTGSLTPGLVFSSL
jgi:hypothetical protein